MPQPLSRVRSDARQQYGPPELARHPKLALHVLNVIQIWAWCDAQLAGLVASFLDADFAVVQAMMQALTGAEGRRAAMRAAAQNRLSGDDFEVYVAVMRAVRPSRDRRNDFAHHLWGASPDIPDALLLMDPGELVSSAFKIEGWVAQHRAGQRPKVTPHRPTNVFVYFERDLKRSVSDAEAASKLIQSFRNSLGATRSGERRVARDELLKDPLLRLALQPKSR